MADLIKLDGKMWDATSIHGVIGNTKILTSGVDFNNLTTTGIYRMSSSVAESCQNAAFNSANNLIVVNIADSSAYGDVGRVVQISFAQNGVQKQRYYATNGWTDWCYVPRMRYGTSTPTSLNNGDLYIKVDSIV